MPEWGYLIIAVGVIIALVAIFFISFIMYKKTPLPKGCENIKIDKEKCGACNNLACPINDKRKEDR